MRRKNEYLKLFFALRSGSLTSKKDSNNLVGNVSEKLKTKETFHCSSTIFLILNKEIEMSKGRDRIISPRKDGTWANKRSDASKASSIHQTQQDAVQAAREMLKNQGGGELTIQGRDGRIRSKDTIAPGNDPLPPRDTEH